MKWTYKMVKIYTQVAANIEKELNELGQQGWELVSWDAGENHFVFKRPHGG